MNAYNLGMMCEESANYQAIQSTMIFMGGPHIFLNTLLPVQQVLF